MCNSCKTSLKQGGKGRDDTLKVVLCLHTCTVAYACRNSCTYIIHTQERGRDGGRKRERGRKRVKDREKEREKEKRYIMGQNLSNFTLRASK